MSYEAKIILDSIGPNDARLTTFELTYPRMVHAELLTHRVFSRNSASSRAIPTEKLLARIEADPVMPVWWGKNQSGMQAREELIGEDLVRAQDRWRAAVLSGVWHARRLGETGFHKQIANRAAELGMFITVIVTATEFDNFFALRDHEAAQPEIADVAGKAHRLWGESEPQRLPAGGWHLPYVTGFDAEDLKVLGADALCLISSGRCAAVSYLNQDKRDPSGDIARADKLAAAGHMSPFEHIAQALTVEGWKAYALSTAELWIHGRVPVGNLWGWRQYRKGLFCEHDFSRIAR
jgi:Thymidylate synthase complementing protein